MALHWEWSGRCGEITLEQKQEDGSWKEYEIRLYTGNAYLIMLWEDDEAQTYSLYGFYADKAHAKNCLGLNKKDGFTDNIYIKPYERWTKVRLNKAKYAHTKELVQMLAEAFDEIVIEIYNEKD